MEKNRFIFISLFYSRDNWTALNVNFVGPMLDEIQLRFHVAAPIIHISRDRGENIGITIPVTETNGLQVAEFIDVQAKSFFHLHPCKRDRKSSRALSFFKDFPVNSIQYNLHTFPFTAGSDPDNDLMLLPFRVVSRLIREILLDEDFYEESPFTFSFYLHLLLIHSLSENMIPAKLLVDKDASGKPEHKQAFDLNKDTLLEITESVLSDEINLSEDNTWMKDWMHTCSDILQKDSTHDPLVFYKKVSAGINRQLGLNVASAEMLSAFIHYCMEKRKPMVMDK